MTTQIGSQFQQEGLFPESEAGLKGTPASQSPEEFRDDPETVFHASYLKIPRDETVHRDHPGLHAGTYQAASERAMSFATPFSDLEQEQRADGRINDDDHTTAKIVTFPVSLRGNRPPEAPAYGSVEDPLSDMDANNNYTIGDDKPKLYDNTAEDVGSLSAVWPRHAVPDQLHQSDWVRDAVKGNRSEGRPDHYGIHPRTYEMWRRGNLDNYDQRTHDQIHSELNAPDEEDRHSGGLFPFKVEQVQQGLNDSDPSHRPWKTVRPTRLVSREEAAQHISGVLGELKANPDSTQYLRHDDHADLEDFVQRPYRDAGKGSGAILRRNVIDSAGEAYSGLRDAGVTTAERVVPSYKPHTYQRIAGDLGDPKRGQQFPRRTS